MLRMRNKLTIILFSLLLIFACSQNKLRFAYEKEQKISEYKEEDHKFCINLGLDFDVDEIETEIYWRCRIALAVNRFNHDETKPETIRHNRTIIQYQNSLENEFQYAMEDLNDYRNSFFNENHHNICTRQGNRIESLNQDEVEKYMNCRYNLIKTFNIDPPFKKTQYLHRPQDSYTIGYVINKRQDEELKKFNAEKEKYPNCVFLNIKTKEYQECKKSYDEQKSCYKTIRQRSSKLEIKERLICQKKMYKRFPDSLLKEKKKEDIKKQIISADIYNNNSFKSIGVDDDMLRTFHSPDHLKKEAEEKKKEQEKEKKERENFNHENKLYTRLELTRLKQKFIAACNQKVTTIIENHENALSDNCRSLTVNWEEKRKNYEQ